MGLVCWNWAKCSNRLLMVQSCAAPSGRSTPWYPLPSVVDACRRGRSSVDADVHPKLNPVASFHAVVFLVARHHHLSHRLGRDPSDHEPRQPFCPNHGTKVKQKKCKRYPYNADGFCILRYGFDAKCLFRCVLLLSNPPVRERLRQHLHARAFESLLTRASHPGRLFFLPT